MHLVGGKPTDDWVQELCLPFICFEQINGKSSLSHEGHSPHPRFYCAASALEADAVINAVCKIFLFFPCFWNVVLFHLASPYWLGIVCWLLVTSVLWVEVINLILGPMRKGSHHTSHSEEENEM